MKKKQILVTIATSIAALVISIGISYVSADTAWKTPTQSPPGANLPVPVHKMIGDQVKAGDLSVNGFIANKQGVLQQKGFFQGKIIAGDPGGTNKTLTIGLVNGANTYSVVTNVTSDVKSTGLLGSTELVATPQKTLCGDDKGHVVFCTPTPPQGGGGNRILVQLSASARPGAICGSPNRIVFVAPPETNVKQNIRIYSDHAMNTPISDQLYIQSVANPVLYPIDNQGVVGAQSAVQC